MAGYTPEDFDYAVRTVWGEARGEPTLGQQSVAAVIRNRAKAAGTGFKNVVLAPNQFEPWGSKRDQLMGLSPQSPEYQRIADTIRPIFDSEADPTKGATHFYSPKVQAALGRKPPSWDNGTGFEIGTHRFFKLGGPVPAAPNSTAQPSPASAPITTGSIPGSPPMADFSTSGLSPEEVALRRRYGQQAYQAGTDASPVGHWTQALARVVQGANAGVWNSQAQQGETEGRKAMVDAIMSGNPKAVLGTPYGASMAPQFLEQSIREADPKRQLELQQGQQSLQNAQQTYRHNEQRQPLQQDLARAQAEQARRKDVMQRYKESILFGEDQPTSPAAPGAVKPMADQAPLPSVPGVTLVSDKPQAPAMDESTMTSGQWLRYQAKKDPQWVLNYLSEQDKNPSKAQEMLDQRRGKLTTGTKTKLEENLSGLVNMRGNLAQVAGQFKPEFLQVSNQAQQWWNAVRDKTGIDKLKLDPQEQAKLSDFARFRSSSIGVLNARLKELSGAAVTESEYRRISSELPNPGTGIADGDSPTQFKAKMDSVLHMANLGIARTHYLIKNGFTGSVEDAAKALPLEAVPQKINEVGNQILQELRVKNPGIADDKLIPQARKEVANLFGIDA